MMGGCTHRVRVVHANVSAVSCGLCGAPLRATPAEEDLLRLVAAWPSIRAKDAEPFVTCDLDLHYAPVAKGK